MTALALLALLQDWPHWRGPERNDVVQEASGWGTAAWPLAAPAWTRNVGAGSGSPLVAGGRLYVMGWSQDQDSVHCLDAASGKELWKASYPCPPHGRHHMGDEQFYSGPTATPELDVAGGRLYTLSTDGDLNAWDAKSGKRLWGLSLHAAFTVKQRPGVGAEQRDYGHITAPYVHENAVLVQVGAVEGCVAAFAKDTGRRLWISECKDAAGHSGGLTPIAVEGVPCLAMMTLTNLVVFRLDKGREGKTVASYPWTTDFGNNVASPAVFEDSVLVTSEYNHKSICRVKVTLKGATKVWETPQSSKACTPLVHGGHVYWAWRKLHCLDFATGQQKWEGGEFGDAGSCIATSDGRILAWGGMGRVSLVEPASSSPAAYTELARAVRLLPGTPWPHLVLAGGRLYLKDRDGNLACIPLQR